MAEQLLGFHTIGEAIHPIKGSENRYRTATNNHTPETQGREVKTVPSTLTPDFTLEGRTAHLDHVEPVEIREQLAKGAFISTEKNPKIEGESESKKALLMGYAPGHVFSGRGGVLLYRDGSELKPVTVTIDTDKGKRKFLLDIKGTGTPDGTLAPHEERIIGGLSDGAKQEFDSLQAAEQQHPLSKDGLIPVAVYYGRDSRGFGQVARAIPTTLRPSFRENDAFDKLRLVSHDQLAYGLGAELGRYLAFSPPLIAENLQAENAYLVNVDDRQEVIATDFMEIVPLHKRVDPFFSLAISFEIIQGSTYESSEALSQAIQGVIKGVGELRPDIAFDIPGFDLSSSDAVAEYLLKKYLAEEIIKNRLSEGIVIDAAYLISQFDPLFAKHYKKNPRFFMPGKLDNYLEEEERLFSYVDQKDEKIVGALQYIKDARKKLKSATDNFEITDDNLHIYEDMLPIPFYK